MTKQPPSQKIVFKVFQWELRQKMGNVMANDRRGIPDDKKVKELGWT